MMPIHGLLLLMFQAVVALSMPAVLAAQESQPVSYADVIQRAYIQAEPDEAGNPPIAVSPDGRTAAFVTGQGDLARNLNVYHLYVFDIARSIRERRLPAPVLKLDIVDEPTWDGTRVDQLRVHTDRRTGHPVATFLYGKPQQVHAVDAVTKERRVLTRHPADVRSYALGLDGNVAIYAAVVDDSADRTPFVSHARMVENGVFILERYLGGTWPIAAAPPAHGGLDALPEEDVDWQVEQAPAPQRVLHYFTLSSPTAAPRRILDCSSAAVGAETSGRWCSDVHTGWANELSVSPDGRYALLWPYAQAGLDDGSPRYGLVDLASGRVTALAVPGKDALDSRHVWSPDGRSVLVVTGDSPDRKALKWVELGIASRSVTPLDIPFDLRPMRWDSATNTLFLRGRGNIQTHFRVATLARTARGWGRVREVTGIPVPLAPKSPSDVSIPKFTPEGLAATNGRVVLGVVQNLAASPEIAAFDLRTRTTTILSDLNPELKRRRLGRVLPFRWRSPNDSAAFGCLVLPPDSVPQRPVPVVVLFDRGHCWYPERPGFILEGPDGARSIPIHTLASSGIAVFLLRGTRAAVEKRSAPNEGAEMQADYESAIRALAAGGLIDSTRVGLSGWSYGAEVTDLLLTRSSFPFAAASKLDGGNFHYGDNRSWTHAELMNVKAPVLVQVHRGIRNRFIHGNFASALRDLGTPAELLYFPTAEHELMTPRHRWRAMNVQTDWFRFWLQGYEDPDPTKREQYKRWRTQAVARDSLMQRRAGAPR